MATLLYEDGLAKKITDTAKCIRYFTSEKYGYDIVNNLKKDNISKDEVLKLYEINKRVYSDLLYKDSRLEVTKEECILAIEIRDKLRDIKKYYDEYDKIQAEKKEAEEFHDLIVQANTAAKNLNELLKENKGTK